MSLNRPCARRRQDAAAAGGALVATPPARSADSRTVDRHRKRDASSLSRGRPTRCTAVHTTSSPTANRPLEAPNGVMTACPYGWLRRAGMTQSSRSSEVAGAPVGRSITQCAPAGASASQSRLAASAAPASARRRAASRNQGAAGASAWPSPSSSSSSAPALPASRSWSAVALDAASDSAAHCDASAVASPRCARPTRPGGGAAVALARMAASSALSAPTTRAGGGKLGGVGTDGGADGHSTTCPAPA